MSVARLVFAVSLVVLFLLSALVVPAQKSRTKDAERH